MYRTKMLLVPAGGALVNVIAVPLVHVKSTPGRCDTPLMLTSKFA